MVMPKEILPGDSSDAVDGISIDQFSRPVDNVTLKEHNIAKYQQVSLVWNPVVCGDHFIYSLVL